MGRRDRERSAPVTAPVDDPAPAPVVVDAAALAPAPDAGEAAPAPAYEHAAHLTPPATTRYRVRGPGMIYVGTRLLGPGKVVDLSPAEAASLAAHVEPA
jgi:hypothetical protein